MKILLTFLILTFSWTALASVSCQDLPASELKLRVVDSGQTQIFAKMPTDGNKIFSVDASNWKIVVDDSGSSVSVRTVEGGREVDLFSGSLVVNGQNFRIFSLVKDSRVSEVKVSLCQNSVATSPGALGMDVEMIFRMQVSFRDGIGALVRESKRMMKKEAVLGNGRLSH